MPVATRGSRRMAVLLLTASIPVNVPPPSENAFRKSAITAEHAHLAGPRVCVSCTVSATIGPNARAVREQPVADQRHVA